MVPLSVKTVSNLKVSREKVISAVGESVNSSLSQEVMKKDPMKRRLSRTEAGNFFLNDPDLLFRLLKCYKIFQLNVKVKSLLTVILSLGFFIGHFR